VNGCPGRLGAPLVLIGRGSVFLKIIEWVPYQKLRRFRVEARLLSGARKFASAGFVGMLLRFKKIFVRPEKGRTEPRREDGFGPWGNRPQLGSILVHSFMFRWTRF
jgi:hypothetical protein